MELSYSDLASRQLTLLVSVLKVPKLLHVSGDNLHVYDSDMESEFLVGIIYRYSKFEVSVCQNNKAMIKFFHE